MPATCDLLSTRAMTMISKVPHAWGLANSSLLLPQSNPPLLMQELPCAKVFCGVNRDMRDIVVLGDILDLKERVYPSSCVRHT